MPTRIDELPADVLDVWLAPLADDPAGAVAFLAEVTDRVARRRGDGRVLVLGGGPVADALAGEGYAVTVASSSRGLPSGARFDAVFVGGDALSRFSGQREQVRAVRSLARVMRPGGALVVQGRQPDPGRWASDVWVREVDCVRQIVVLGGSELRYVWPAELDLMAELAELALDSRWGGWYGEPVECGGPVVSVYRS
ncbi:MULTISPECIES: hypothetical protein [unclassified Amycolatopsis]|uniref:hypothetical protein n=1 Tax=unclassified Amycolatopsis TaxID=2618356 RepID=UPI001C69AB4D|nr:hypothetical protein [Amycolatopsis sp. DSM 110486]QYN22236.1 hypothetical protein K1T34_07005 [Amycolatopsis sp. DSM 110486]